MEWGEAFEVGHRMDGGAWIDGGEVRTDRAHWRQDEDSKGGQTHAERQDHAPDVGDFKQGIRSRGDIFVVL